MVPSFLITFRETLEAALVVGIILSYLKRTHQPGYYHAVTIGVLSRVLASIIGALFLFVLPVDSVGEGNKSSRASPCS